MRTIIIGDSEEDSDWIKKIGNYQEEDLKASELASQMNKGAKKNLNIKKLFKRLGKK